MLLLEEDLCKNEEMADHIEAKKKLLRARRSPSQKKKPARESFINSFFTRATQRTVRFIRWLRYGLSRKASYRESLTELAKVWGCKIT